MNDYPDGIGEHARRMVAESEAKRIARAIFECPAGCAPNQVRRIQFRDRDERDLGGLNEHALVCVIREALEQKP